MSTNEFGKKFPKRNFQKKHSNSIKCLIYKRKTAVFIAVVCIGDPNGIRTRVAALRGPRPKPLDDGTKRIIIFFNLNYKGLQEIF